MSVPKELSERISPRSFLKKYSIPQKSSERKFPRSFLKEYSIG